MFVLQDDIKEWLNIQSSDPMSLKFLQFTEIIVSANTAVNNIYSVYRKTWTDGKRMVNTPSSKSYLQFKMFLPTKGFMNRPK